MSSQPLSRRWRVNSSRAKVPPRPAAGASIVHVHCRNDDGSNTSDVARFEAALEADGWHAGQEDLAGHDVGALRARLGTRVFGVSCGVAEEARAAAAAGADYVGTGPFAVTATKGDAGPAIGIEGVRAVVLATSMPVVAIGGIDTSNLAAVKSSGAAMAAVVSALVRGGDPRAAAAQLIACWNAPPA